MTTNKKRLLSIFMALCMVFSMLPLSAFASNDIELQREKQILNTGKTVFYGANENVIEGATSVTDKDVVASVSKTLKATGTENIFDVTLQVKTSAHLTELTGGTPDAAIVFVLDVSNSMAYCSVCGQDNTSANHCKNCGKTKSNHSKKDCNGFSSCSNGAKTESRLVQAKSAAGQFIDKFALETGAQEGDKRLVQIVAFDSNANTKTTQWVDVNDRTDKNNDGIYDTITTLKSTVNGISAASCGTPNADDKDNKKAGGTNIEGGLMLARNLLQDGTKQGNALEKIGYMYTIMLTDGAPTFNVQADTDATSAITGFAGGYTKTISDDIKDVPYVAKDITNLTTQGRSSKLYSICYGTGVASEKPFPSYRYPSAYSSSNTTKDKTTILQWLSSYSTNAYAAGDDQSLFDSFDSIVSQIALAAKAWRVTDPMGDCVNFIEEIKVDGVKNDVAFSDNDRQFVWNILGSNPDKSSTYKEETKEGILSYTYQYRIHLDTSHPKFDPKQEQKTNGDTILKYVVCNDKGEWPTDESEIKTAHFEVPTVKGYQADVGFAKLTEQNAVLSRAEFTLTKDGAVGAKWTQTAESGIRISIVNPYNVKFYGVPSGYSYTLKETKAPSDFIPSDKTSTVTVKYGEVSFAGDLVDTQKFKTACGTTVSHSVKNALDPQNIQVTVQKNWVGVEDAGNGQTVTVGVYQANEKGEAIGQAVDTLSIIGTASVTSKELPSVDTKTGKDIAYTVKEEESNNYKQVAMRGGSLGGVHDNYSFTITNLQNQNQDVTVKKIWVGPVPDQSLQVTLYRDGKEYKRGISLSKDNAWEQTIKDVPTFADDATGDRSVYTVAEFVNEKDRGTGVISIDGRDYMVSVNGTTITNTVAQKETSVSGTKTWNVAGLEDKSNLEASFELFADEKATGITTSVKYSDQTNNGFSFTQLPKYALPFDQQGALKDLRAIVGTDGHEIVYSVKESGTGNDLILSSKDEADNFTNTLTDTVDINVEKVWANDSGNKHETRPDSVTLVLSGNGKDYEKTFTANKLEKEVPEQTPAPEGGDESSQAPAPEGGDESSQTPAPEGGDGSNQTPAPEGGEGSNQTPAPESGEGSNQTPAPEGGDNQTPATVLANVPVSALTNAANTESKDKEPVTKTETVLSWENVNLQHTFENLPKYDASGALINYTVSEKGAVDGKIAGKSNVNYAVTTQGSAANGFKVTNTLNGEEVSITLAKQWIDTFNDAQREAAGISTTITATLGDQVLGKLTTSANASEIFTFIMPDEMKGQLQVVETAVEGYNKGNPAQAQLVDNTYTFTNTIDQSADITVYGEKTWVGGSDEFRPDVTFTLWMNGAATTQTIANGDEGYVYNSDSGKFEFSFTGLEKYSFANGGCTLNTYEIKETMKGEQKLLDRYTAVASTDVNEQGAPLFRFTNTFDDGSKDNNIAGKKVWLAGGANYGEVSVALYKEADQSQVATQDTVNLEYLFEKIPAYEANGDRISYYVRELDNTGAPIDQEGTYSADGKVFTVRYVGNHQITNMIPNSKTEITVDKIWQGPIGESATFTLTRSSNGQQDASFAPQTLTLTAEQVSATDKNTWKGSFKDLDTVDQNGYTYQYDVAEAGFVANEGKYTQNKSSNGNSFVFTNTIEQAQRSLTVEKVWDGGQYSKMDDAKVEVQLYAGGVPVDGRILSLNASTEWKGEFKELNVYNEQTFAPIQYTVKELGEDGGMIGFNHDQEQYAVVYSYATANKAEETQPSSASEETPIVVTDATITNTYKNQETYQYKVYRYYDRTVNGIAQTTRTQHDESWTVGSENQTVTIDPSSGVSFDGVTYTVSKAVVNGVAQANGNFDVILKKMADGSTAYEIHLYYTNTYNGGGSSSGGSTGGGSGGGNSGGGGTIDIPDTEPPLAEGPGDEGLTDIPETDTPLAETPSDGELTEITDEAPPLAGAPEGEELVEIQEENVPLGNAPKTGDENLNTLWITLMVLAGMGLTVLTFFGKAKKDQESDED